MSKESSPDRARTLAHALACAAEDGKGEGIRILDVANLLFITDYFVIVTTMAARQTRGLAENLRDTGKELGFGRGSLEGDHNSSWLLVDFDSVVVHVLTEEAREFYDLDLLWAEAPEVEVEAA